MTIEIKVPVLPESVQDATIATWHKKPGEKIEQDENLVDIETDKVVLEVVAPETGYLEKILKDTGETVKAEEVIAVFKASKEAPAKAAQEPQKKEPPPSKEEPAKKEPPSKEEPPKKEPPGKEPPQEEPPKKGPEKEFSKEEATKKGSEESSMGPAARRKFAQEETKTTSTIKRETSKSEDKIETLSGNRIEKRLPMTRLRARIAERLLSAQQNAAILTTFNEINMQNVMDLRARYKDPFEKAHGVKLGFMSFFTKAVIESLKRFPVVNASIDGKDIVYHGYFDIAIAVSSPRGLVVPIIRDADKLSMAEIEKAINELGNKAKEGTLSIEEITGGTFTISNGGVFGSLLSTPILNPPQTGILGMHKIEQRPIVDNGQIVIKPMMYVAFSYDHRLIDGAESVRFLVTIKELLEDPARLLLDI